MPIAIVAMLIGTSIVTGGSLARASEDCILVDDFANAPVGAFPPGWRPRKASGRDIYTVEEENGRRFLHAVARDTGIQAARQFAWDIATYPVLVWSWRPRQAPENADEVAGRNDSVLGVYAVFPYSRFAVKSVKYIWSETARVDTHLTSSGGLTQVRVVRSGAAGFGEWTEQRVDVRADYARYFGDASAPKPEGLAVLTDADDTHGVAIGDYADFRVCRRLVPRTGH